MSVKPFIACLLIWSSLAGAAPRTEAEIREAVQTIIIQRHPSDNFEIWRQLGPGAPEVIIRMYEQSSDSVERAQLIGGLAAFGGDPGVVDFLKKQASESRESVIKQKSLAAIGASLDKGTVDFLAKFLNDADPQVRFAAAAALRKAGADDTRSREILEAYLKTEKAPWIAGKLKGEASPAPRRLQPVASSEDRASADFAGVWKGVLLTPDPARGLASRPVELRVNVRGVQELTMTWVLDPGDPRAQAVEFKGWKARGLRAEGMIPGKALVLAPLAKSESFSYTAEVESDPQGLRLVVKSKDSASFVVLRKKVVGE